MGFVRHPLPHCFVCGPKRAEGDGLRIFPGRTANEAVFAAPWVPHASLDDGTGQVAPEFLWAALDCAGAFAVMPDGDQPIILGELCARLDGDVAIGEPCVVAVRAGAPGRDATGENHLRHGAVGGVRLAAVKLARHFGARVIAGVGSDDKLVLLGQYGIEAAVNYRTENLRESVINDGNRAERFSGGAGCLRLRLYENAKSRRLRGSFDPWLKVDRRSVGSTRERSPERPKCRRAGESRRPPPLPKGP